MRPTLFFPPRFAVIRILGCGEGIGEGQTFVGLLWLNPVIRSDGMWWRLHQSSPRSHTHMKASRKTANGRAQHTPLTFCHLSSTMETSSRQRSALACKRWSSKRPADLPGGGVCSTCGVRDSGFARFGFQRLHDARPGNPRRAHLPQPFTQRQKGKWPRHSARLMTHARIAGLRCGGCRLAANCSVGYSPSPPAARCKPCRQRDPTLRPERASGIPPRITEGSAGQQPPPAHQYQHRRYTTYPFMAEQCATSSLRR